MQLYIGLLSGTSMDGIDAAIVDVARHQLIAAITERYCEETEQRLQKLIRNKHCTLEDYAHLNVLIGQDFAETVHKLLNIAQLNPENIMAIGSHGQTILHEPLSSIPYTIQLGCAHTIAEKTRIPVVADFRTRDMIVGGQGAPLAPLYHQALYQKQKMPLAVINIGGIANISYLETPEDVLGFDIGPGNCLLDAWIKEKHNKLYDSNGDWARSGALIPELLAEVMKDPFFHKSYPKSIDKGYFSLSWLTQYLDRSYKASDIQNTLAHITALSISESIAGMPQTVRAVYICGGGALNSYLMELIQKYLKNIPVHSTKDQKIDPNFIEAMLFAWLASKTMNKEPLNCVRITGAKRKAILGVIYPYG